MPVSINNGRLRVAVSYSPSVVAAIKSIPGRKFEAATKTWSVPLEFLPALKEKLPHLAYGPECEVEYRRLMRTVDASQAMDTDTDKIEVSLPGGTLRPYQAAGVRYLEAKHGRAMIADEMGLGKTVQTLAYLHRHPDLRAAIVCPAAVKEQWKREMVRWLHVDADLQIDVLQGKKPAPVMAQYAILNYDILADWVDYLTIDVLVLDESVAIKERKSKRSQAAHALAGRAKHVIALSGRPVLNRPAELWNQLTAVRPDMPFGSWSQFNQRYNGLHQIKIGWDSEQKKTKYGWELGEPDHLDELEERLRAHVMLQRRKHDVLTELPDLERVTVPLEVDTKQYERALGSMHGLDLPGITELRRLAGLAKIQPAIEWILEAQENLGQIVVFAHHHDVLDEIARALNATPPVDGRLPQKARQEMIDQFQGGDFSVLVCGTRAMGVGVNLQAASTCVFVEEDWNMATHEQAESRMHRMGQKKAVTAYYLVALGTIDEDLMQLLADKQTVSEQIVGEEPTPRVLDRLRELLGREGT